MLAMTGVQQQAALYRTVKKAGKLTSRGWHARAGSAFLPGDQLPGEDVSHIPLQLVWHSSECQPLPFKEPPFVNWPLSVAPLMLKSSGEPAGFPGPSGEFQKDMPPRRDVPASHPDKDGISEDDQHNPVDQPHPDTDKYAPPSPDEPHPDTDKSGYSTPGTNPDLPDNPKKEYTPPQKKQQPQNASSATGSMSQGSQGLETLATKKKRKPLKAPSSMVGLALGEAFALDQMHYDFHRVINKAMTAAKGRLHAVRELHVAPAVQSAGRPTEEELGGSGTVHPHLPDPDTHGRSEDAPANGKQPKQRKPKGSAKTDSKGQKKSDTPPDDDLSDIAPETGQHKDVEPGSSAS